MGGGKFEELIGEGGPGIEEAHASRGVAFGDFDNDGDIDILIMNQNEPPSLLRNDVSGESPWLKVKLVGTKSNRSAHWGDGDCELRRQEAGAGGDGAVGVSYR